MISLNKLSPIIPFKSFPAFPHLSPPPSERVNFAPPTKALAQKQIAPVPMFAASHFFVPKIRPPFIVRPVYSDIYGVRAQQPAWVGTPETALFWIEPNQRTWARDY